MKKNCLVCNKEFITYPSKIKLGRGKYCSKECCLKITNNILEENGIKSRFFKGQPPTNFKGGKCIHKPRKTSRGYVVIYKPSHPLVNNRGYVPEHRLIVEDKIGRYLTRNEVVHHINGNTLDNRIENLQLLTDTEHRRIHLKDNVHKRWQNQELNLLQNKESLLINI